MSMQALRARSLPVRRIKKRTKSAGALRQGRELVFLLAAIFALPACAQMTLVPGITTVAGTGSAGYSGDNGAATSAKMNIPAGVGIDGSGNIYITEFGGCRIRKVTIATGDISTVAGNGTCGNTADGGQATSAEINVPNGRVAFDSSGNFYFAETSNNKVRKVNISTGVITTVAGNGTAGSTGDGAAATSAKLNQPYDVYIDSSNNLYIADSGNNKIRKVTNSTGYISTVAGNGTPGSTGDGAAATSAELDGPQCVALDSAGNIYIGDYYNNKVRKVTISTGYISTVAGTGTGGFSGDGGAATSAKVYGPSGIVFDSFGNFYIADPNTYRVRMVNIGTGIINTVAGNGSNGYSGDGGTAISAEMYYPNGLAMDSSGNLYIADFINSVIRKVLISLSFPTTALGSTSASQNVFMETSASEKITSFTAQQSQGSKQEFTIGTVSGCSLNTTYASGTICTLPITFSPAYPGLRAVPLQVVTTNGTPNINFGLTGTGTGPLAALIPGTISTVAGNGTAGETGNGAAATSAELNAPNRVAVDSAGNIYIADYNGNTVRKVTASTGNVSVLAGTGTAGYSGDNGAATSAKLNGPNGVGVDSAGNVYIADSPNCRIRKVTVATGNITTVAGNGTCGYSGDGGAATSANIYNVSSDIVFDGGGDFIFADSGNNRVREVNISTGVITTIAGNGTAGSTGDSGLATSAELNYPINVALDSAGNLYIADYNNNKIRKVSEGTGIITTLAGNGTAGYSGDGGAATSAELHIPAGVDVDAAGNIYIADQSNNRIRFVDAATGIITTIAGNGTAGFAGDTGAATAGELNGPPDVTLDGAGNLIIADSSNNRVRKVTVNASPMTFATSTAVGEADSTDDPLSATMINIGNAGMTVNVPSSGTNPSVSSYFTLDNSTTCPDLNTSSSAGTLASGAECTIAVDFYPTVAGSVTGSVIVTDNSLGGSATTQTINTTATAIAVNTTTTITSSGTPSTYGTSVTFTATVNPVAGSAVPTGTVQFSVDGSNVGSPVSLSSQTATYSTSTLAAGTHSIGAVYAGTANYNTSTASTFTQTVNDSTPTVTAWPTASAITYGQTLASSTLTGGTASVGGTFAWTTSSTSPGVGSTSESVTFTPTNITDYNTVVGSVTVTVNKATPTVSAWPTASAITYGQTLASSTLTGGTASVGGTFAWTTSSTAPGAGSPSESVTFTPTNTTDYNTVVGSVSPTVNKATPTVSAWPTASAITYGQTLASSTLTGGTASVGGTFAWTTSSTAPGAGSPSESVTFTPSDTTDYNTVVGSVSPTVNKATPTVSAWPTASAITYGQTLASSTLTGGTASVGGTFAWTTSSTAPGAGSPSESVTFTPTDTTDYNTPSAGSVTVTVNKATPTVSAWPTASAITYGQTLASSTLTGGTASVGGTFAWTTSSTSPGAGTPSESVTFTPSDTTDYNTPTAGSITVTVNKATPTVSAWPTASAITYGQTLASSTLTGGTASVGGTFAWTTASTAPGAGSPSESVTFTPSDTTDYNTPTAGSITVTVNKATPTVSAWPTASAITYSQTLASSTLSGGTASVGGTFAWTLPGTVPFGGSQPESVTFTPSDTTDYNVPAASSVTVTVNKSSVTINGTTSRTLDYYGDSVTLTYTFTGTGATPTGTATIKDGSTTLGTATLSAGVATYTTSALAAASHTVTAVYNGDGNYQ